MLSNGVNSAALDFETTPTLNVTVQAEDTGTLTGTATITTNRSNIDPVGETLAVIDAVKELKDSGVLSNGEANSLFILGRDSVSYDAGHWSLATTIVANHPSRLRGPQIIP